MEILPTARKVAKWMAFVGLICGVVYSFGGFFIDLFTTGLNWGTPLAFLALLGMPLLFGAFGLLMGILLALLARGFLRVRDLIRGD